MKFRFILSAVMLCSVLSMGQTKKWTLQECVERALSENINIKQSELNVEAAEIDQLLALGNFLPSINARSSVSENTGLSFNPVTNNAQTTTFLSVTGGASIGYTLFDGLRMFREDQRAKLSKLAAQYRLEKMEDDIALTVANGFLQVVLNKENLKVLEAQNAVTQNQIERTQQLVDGGVLPQGDLLEVRAQNANEIQNIVAAENAVQISLISLAQTLLIKDYKNFDIQDSDFGIQGEEILLLDPSEIVESAKEERFEILIAEKDLELALKDMQLAKGAYYPTISAFFGYDTRYTDATSFRQQIDQDNPFSIQQIGYVEATNQAVVTQSPNFISRIVGADPFIEQLYQNDGIGYGLSLNIPIFNGFNTRASVQRSKINVARNRFQLEQATLDLESNVYQAYLDAQGSLKAYEAAQAAAASQELAYDYAKERYDVGLTNAFDFSQAKQRYDNARIQLNQTKYEYIFRLKVLELYFGIPPQDLKF